MAAIQIWRAGKDFKIVDGPYCSVRDVDAMRNEGFDMLEFVGHDGALVERIIIDEDLACIAESGHGTFTRVA